MANVYLDCKGICCPMPIVETAKRFKGLQIGDTLEVDSDDPAFRPDIEAWVECMNYKLISVTGTEIVRAVIEKTQ